MTLPTSPSSAARANASARARSAGPSPSASAERPLAVAEREPRAGAGADGIDAARLQPLGELPRRRRVEAHALAARGDRRQHLRRAVGEEDQDDVARRLLERLEQRVGGRVVHRVGALEHEHAPGRLERRVRGGGHHRLVDVAAQHDVGAARRHPGEVGMRAGERAGAGVLRVGRVAREQLGGELARGLALARAGRAVEQVGVRGRSRRAAPSTAAACGWASRTLTVMILGVRSGRLITVEGLDGAGKTTLVAGVTRELAARGRELLVLREPGGVELSERIRELVKDPALAVDPRAEALLYAAARAQLVAEQLVPLLDAGEWILLDRFVDSSLAYQGAGRGLGVEEIRALNAFATGGLTPDLTLLLRIEPAVGAARIAGREADRLELAGEPFFAAVGARLRRARGRRAGALRGDRGRPAARAGARRRPRGARAAALAPAPEQQQDRDQEAEPAQDLRVLEPADDHRADQAPDVERLGLGRRLRARRRRAGRAALGCGGWASAARRASGPSAARRGWARTRSASPARRRRPPRASAGCRASPRRASPRGSSRTGRRACRRPP